MMNDVLTAISTVGFPAVMCGALCYYIYKVQTPLIEAINKNSFFQKSQCKTAKSP